MSKIKNTFSNPNSLLRFLRIRLGQSQQKVANAIGLTANDISRFEHGERGMYIPKALRLASYFGVSIDELLHDRYDGALSKPLPAPKRNTEAQKCMKRRQRLRDKIGRDGEAYVAKLERNKLRGSVYENGVNEGYADDPTAGFDIMSFAPDGTIIYIEVKTTRGKASEPFYITAHERRFMEYCLQNGYRYELHRVHHIGSRKKVGRVIYTAEELMGFHYEPCTYLVKEMA